MIVYHKRECPSSGSILEWRMYLNNRRNLVFRCSIVINVAVLMYAALQLAGGPGAPSVEWVPLHVPGADRTLNSYSEPAPARNFTGDLGQAALEFETTSSRQRTPPTNRTAPSTAEAERKAPSSSASPSSPSSPSEAGGELEQQDEEALSEATLARLRALLACRERDARPATHQHGEFWALVNYVPADHGALACHEAVTYTTHAGFEFLDNVLPLVERWMAPVSLAMHAPGADLAPAVASVRYLRDCTGSDLVRNFVTFHIFFSSSHMPSSLPDPDSFLSTPYNCSLPPPYVVNASDTYKTKKGLLYPVNVARNIAREAALTHYILASDIELYPSPGLVPRFLNMVARNERPLNTSTNPRVFPISIFEVDKKAKVPTSKTELQKMLATRAAIPFHKSLCPNCHSIPQGLQWMKANETATMGIFHVGKRRGKFLHWEPIFIGTHADPLYDERLSWEGKQDKMTQGYILCVKDYDFMILNNAFIIHKPGIKKYRRDAKRDSVSARQGKLIKNTIYPELKKLYGTRAGCVI